MATSDSHDVCPPKGQGRRFGVTRRVDKPSKASKIALERREYRGTLDTSGIKRGPRGPYKKRGNQP